MASRTQWTWVWVNSGSWWWTGRPGVLQFIGLQRVGHDWATEMNWTELIDLPTTLPFRIKSKWSVNSYSEQCRPTWGSKWESSSSSQSLPTSCLFFLSFYFFDTHRIFVILHYLHGLTSIEKKTWDLELVIQWYVPEHRANRKPTKNLNLGLETLHYKLFL